MSTTVTYKSTTADDRYATELTVDPDGVGRLSVGSNRDRRADPIGRFQGRVPQPLLHRLAAGSAVLAAAAAAAPLAPDEAYREISVAAPGAAPQRAVLGGPGAPAPALAELERTLLEVAEHLRRSPQAALGLHLQLPATLRAGAMLEIELRLANAGPATLRLPAPRLWQTAGTVCELMLLRADIPIAALSPADQHFVRVGSANLLQVDPPNAAAELVLAPAQEARLRFGFAAGWKPARYSVELSLDTAVRDDSLPQPWRGGLVSATQTIEILPA